MNNNLKEHHEYRRELNSPESIRSFKWASPKKKEELIDLTVKIKKQLKQYSQVDTMATKSKMDIAKKVNPMIDSIQKEVVKVQSSNKALRNFGHICKVLFNSKANRIYELMAIGKVLEFDLTEKHLSSTSMIRIGEALRSRLESKREAANTLICKAKKHDKYIPYKEVIASLRTEEGKTKKNLKSTSVTPTELLGSIKSITDSNQVLDEHDVELIFECAVEVLKLTSELFKKSKKSFKMKGARSHLTEVWSTLKLNIDHPVN